MQACRTFPTRCYFGSLRYANFRPARLPHNSPTSEPPSSDSYLKYQVQNAYKQLIGRSRKFSSLSTLRSTYEPFFSEPNPDVDIEFSTSRESESEYTLEDILRLNYLGREIPNVWTSNEVTQEVLKTAYRGISVEHELGILLLELKVKPQVQHYEAIVLSNCSPWAGSADNVRQLLEECAEEDIFLGQTILKAALKALAIHPDPNLLTQVLETCTLKWVDLDEEMHQLVALSYLRSGQIEVAQEQMLQLRKNFSIPPWLQAILIRTLADRGDWDTILRTCYELQDNHMRQLYIPYGFWNWLLHKAAAEREPWITQWVWNLWVENVWITPDIETIMNVLEIAANEGIPKLAESAATVLKHSQDPSENMDKIVTASRLVKQAYDKANLPPPPSDVPNLQRSGVMWKLFKDIGDLGSPKINPWKAIASINPSRTMYDYEKRLEGSRAGDERARAKRESLEPDLVLEHHLVHDRKTADVAEDNSLSREIEDENLHRLFEESDSQAEHPDKEKFQ